MSLTDTFQIITLLVNIYISFTEKKKRIYIATFLLNLSQLLMYKYNNDTTTMLIYYIITIRSFIYIIRDKFKTNIIPYTVIVLQLAIGFYTIERPVQLMSILIPCYTTWYLWFYKDTQKLRIGNIIANFVWAVYNFIGGLYIVLIMRLITILSNLIAYSKREFELKTSNMPN